MKKTIKKISTDFQYKKYMWTCNKVFNPDASFFQRISLYRELMKEAKTAKIPRIDNIEEYLKDREDKK